MDYRKIYAALVQKCASNLELRGYFERHHIVPRALGGGDDVSNLVNMSAREHYIAHFLLWKIHRNRQTARAFTLLARGMSHTSSRAYAKAKEEYAASMRGANSVSKRPEVRAKISVNNARAMSGVHRHEHSALLKSRGTWTKERNPMWGRGSAQLGGLNPSAVSIIGYHDGHGVRAWVTVAAAAEALGVSPAAVSAAYRRNGKCSGWRLERLG